jgi:hypothetical protein
MNIESLGRQSLQKLKAYPNFPSTGFIAGGSIANLIWENVSGIKAIINDIDVFVFDKLLDKLEITDLIGQRESKRRLFYHQKETK